MTVDRSMPKTLAGFRVQSELGRGGMGVVYACWDESLQRRVAVKVLAAELAADADLRSRFLREARAAAALSHPNIATVYAVHATADEPPAIVMELVEGYDLRRHLKDGPLDVAEALRIAAGVASAIAKAHAAGIVHRDLKPENILLGEEGMVKLLDFGIAKALDRGPDLGTGAGLTATGQVIGTAGYMAPEQIDGLTIDPRTDVFAFGVIVFEMLSGRVAYDGNSAAQRMAAVLRDPPADLLTLAPETPEDVAAWIRECIERDREKRPADGAALVARLAELRATLRAVTPAPRSTAGREAAGREAAGRDGAGRDSAASEPIPLVAGASTSAAVSNPTPPARAAQTPAPVDFDARTELSASSDVSRQAKPPIREASATGPSAPPRNTSRTLLIVGALIAVAIGGALIISPPSVRVDVNTTTSASAAANSSAAPAPSAAVVPLGSASPDPAPSRVEDDPRPWLVEMPKPSNIPTAFECRSIQGADASGCSDGVVAWCDTKERRIACCAEGLVPHDTDGACGCPPGGSSTPPGSAPAGSSTPAGSAAPPGSSAPGDTAPKDASGSRCVAKPYHKGMSPESIQMAVRARFGEISKCYGKALEASPDQAGKVTLSMLIAPNGRLFSVRVGESTLSLPEAQKCMLESIRKIEFPPPRGAHGITVTYPIDLAPG